MSKQRELEDIKREFSLNETNIEVNEDDDVETEDENEEEKD